MTCSRPLTHLLQSFPAVCAQSDPIVTSKLACASGLYCLEQGRYKAAALKFTEVCGAGLGGEGGWGVQGLGGNVSLLL